MAENDTQTVNRKSGYALEFWLVVVMLIALVILVVAVLFWPITPFTPQPTGREAAFKDILEYRTNILAVIVTAFGAWVGAGAAYFFGRENLRVAADSLLAMREVSPRERLRRTSIKQIPPTTIDWMVKRDTLITEVREKLLKEPSRWFIPIVKADGSLETVINEEAAWRFLLEKTPPPETKVEELLAYIEATPDLKRFNQIHVVVTMKTTVGAANDLMDSRHVFLAIVETDGKPTHFFTTSEVRKLLLQSSPTQ